MCFRQILAPKSTTPLRLFAKQFPDTVVTEANALGAITAGGWPAAKRTNEMLRRLRFSLTHTFAKVSMDAGLALWGASKEHSRSRFQPSQFGTRSRRYNFTICTLTDPSPPNRPRGVTQCCCTRPSHVVSGTWPLSDVVGPGNAALSYTTRAWRLGYGSAHEAGS